MTDKELVAAFSELRIHCVNIIGFHIEAEREGSEVMEADQVMFQAQVYAGGVELAYRVLAIAHALDGREG